MAFRANLLLLIGVVVILVVGQVQGRRMELYREPNTIVQSFGWPGAVPKPNNNKAFCYGMCPCPYNWDPLCGNDGKTYANDCMLRCQRNKCNPYLKVALRSECDADDAWAHRSV